MKRALAPLLRQALPDVPINRREIPGEVERPGLEHGAGGGGGIPPALQLHRVKEGAVGDVIVRIDLEERHISRLEFHELVRPRADRFEIIRRLARLRPLVLRNAESDQLWRQARTELDPVKRAALFIRMNNLVIEDVVVIPEVWLHNVSAVSHSLRGLELGPWDRTLWNLAYWYREP